eukprot:4990133-Heterocapsa_arctica.AAC.1
MEPPAEDPTQRVRARRMRGLAVLDPSTGGSSSGLLLIAVVVAMLLAQAPAAAPVPAKLVLLTRPSKTH